MVKLLVTASEVPRAHTSSIRRSEPVRPARDRNWRLASAVIAALALSGCAGLQSLTSGPDDHAEVLKALGDHIEGCDRHYQGGMGLGASFTFNIDCKARVVPLSEFGKP